MQKLHFSRNLIKIQWRPLIFLQARLRWPQGPFFIARLSVRTQGKVTTARENKQENGAH
jgi:hypothetical protein